MRSLGQRFYEKEVDKRKDETELKTHDNLISCTDEEPFMGRHFF